MSELVEFIRGCMDADEQTARAALAPAEMFPYGDESLTPFTREQVPDAVRGYLGGTWGAHFARHDPARVLAEVNAKRAILDALVHEEWFLLVLAQPFAGEPGWRDEWGTQ